jgi:hypothetical protein
MYDISLYLQQKHKLLLLSLEEAQPQALLSGYYLMLAKECSNMLE